MNDKITANAETLDSNYNRTRSLSGCVGRVDNFTLIIGSRILVRTHGYSASTVYKPYSYSSLRATILIHKTEVNLKKFLHRLV